MYGRCLLRPNLSIFHVAANLVFARITTLIYTVYFFVGTIREPSVYD